MKIEKDNQKFQKQKKRQLSRKDKSNEGKWDDAIKPLCEKINSKENYYTNSSCAGRIILVKGKKEKTKDAFLFKSHDKINFEDFKKELKEISKNYNELVYFKVDSCILHVTCQDLEDAEKFLNKARNAGWKRSGIFTLTNKIVIELISTEGMELPIMNKGKILVDDNYLKLLTEKSNEKLERTREKIKKFESLIQK